MSQDDLIKHLEYLLDEAKNNRYNTLIDSLSIKVKELNSTIETHWIKGD